MNAIEIGFAQELKKCS